MTPGTVTAELVTLGIPMVVVTPLNNEEIVIDGIMNYTGKIPVVGKKIKRNAVLNVAKKMNMLLFPTRRLTSILCRNLLEFWTRRMLLSEQ